ncbi:protein of unknown function [Cyanobium sp. NIES-981]|nr:protein of unknown function [Cyanobium sp. NIES-981]
MDSADRSFSVIYLKSSEWRLSYLLLTGILD